MKHSQWMMNEFKNWLVGNIHRFNYAPVLFKRSGRFDIYKFKGVTARIKLLIMPGQLIVTMGSYDILADFEIAPGQTKRGLYFVCTVKENEIIIKTKHRCIVRILFGH